MWFVSPTGWRNKLDVEEELGVDVELDVEDLCRFELCLVSVPHTLQFRFLHRVQPDVHVHHAVHFFVSFSEMSLRAQPVVHVLHNLQLCMTG